MSNRYTTDDGDLRWDAAADILCDLCDGYLGTLDGVEYANASGGSGSLRDLFGDGENDDIDPDRLGSRLLKSVSQLHGISSDYRIKGDPEAEVVYRMAKFTPVASKLSGRYAMEDKVYREHWHDDVLDICEAITERNRDLQHE